MKRTIIWILILPLSNAYGMDALLKTRNSTPSYRTNSRASVYQHALEQQISAISSSQFSYNTYKLKKCNNVLPTQRGNNRPVTVSLEQWLASTQNELQSLLQVEDLARLNSVDALLKHQIVLGAAHNTQALQAFNEKTTAVAILMGKVNIVNYLVLTAILRSPEQNQVGVSLLEMPLDDAPARMPCAMLAIASGDKDVYMCLAKYNVSLDKTYIFNLSDKNILFTQQEQQAERFKYLFWPLCDESDSEQESDEKDNDRVCAERANFLRITPAQFAFVKNNSVWQHIKEQRPDIEQAMNNTIEEIQKRYFSQSSADMLRATGHIIEKHNQDVERIIKKHEQEIAANLN